ncbi:hypothetical protein M9H77_31728 [Catharanthus roseus]|uniref:Uncharacterized protein n=1 Tax=Catharanthus roseus TaxID=4058 RepID=A0ACC0A4S7_CATRO|nr:hypothetical protein M9H77_31728 [Catharanthus roseus]
MVSCPTVGGRLQALFGTSNLRPTADGRSRPTIGSRVRDGQRVGFSRGKRVGVDPIWRSIDVDPNWNFFMRPVAKMTRSGIRVLSLQTGEDDDEAESSDDEEDEAGAQNTTPMDAFKIEMWTAFEELRINKEIQGMQLTEIIESTCHYVNELRHQRTAIDREGVILAHLCNKFMPDQGICRNKCILAI